MRKIWRLKYCCRSATFCPKRDVSGWVICDIQIIDNPKRMNSYMHDAVKTAIRSKGVLIGWFGHVSETINEAAELREPGEVGQSIADS